MMKYKKIIITLVIILLLNIVLTGFLDVTIKRPLLYYEYIFLPLVLIIVRKHFLKLVVFMGLVLTDIIYNLSHLYYFDVFNYVEKLPYLFISHFSIQFWVIAILGLLLFIGLSNFLIGLFDKKIIELGNKKYRINIVVAASFFLFIYTVDSLNGSSLLGTVQKGRTIINIRTEKRGEYNLGKSLFKDLYTDYKLYKLGQKSVHEIADFKNIDGDSSLSYKYFYNSTGNNEILIVLESWGGYLDDTLMQNQLAPFLQIDSHRYDVKMEKSYFDGATVQAESRELLNKEGEAYFSVINHNSCDIKSLIQKKKEAGYTTMAVQPFMGAYSVGARFKKLIGFSNFKDYSFFHDTLGYAPVFNNQYTAVKDEAVFEWIFKNTSSAKKSFTYCLSINTHLPFHLNQRVNKNPLYKPFTEKYKNYFPSTQSLKRYFRMSEELSYLAALINKYDVDRVIIVGDHAPPYLFKEERSLFSDHLVPAIIIQKK